MRTAPARPRPVSDRSSLLTSTAGRAHLTPRQREALRELATGATYEQAAYRLGMSRHTLGRHLGDAYEALGAGGAVEAFVALGWLRPEDP